MARSPGSACPTTAFTCVKSRRSGAIYGVLEGQFRKVYKEADRRKGQ
jgi:hypothetical protein